MFFNKFKKNKGLTLAEMLTALAIIGIIAAAVVSFMLFVTAQHKYKTELKNALFTLNQAIELSITLDEHGPYDTQSMEKIDNSNLYQMFKKRMNAIEEIQPYSYKNTTVYGFYTTDGIKYEFIQDPSVLSNEFAKNNFKCSSPNNMSEDGETVNDFNKPCLVIVDVNKNSKSYDEILNSDNKKMNGVFPIVVTEKNAYPYDRALRQEIFMED